MGSIDCVKLLNEEHWVTSGEDGHLSTWGVMKKKPLVTVANCHGQDENNGDPHWVSALATLYNTDMVVTGSRDGWVRFWSVGEGYKSLREVQKVKMSGFVNSLAISADGRYLGAGTQARSLVERQECQEQDRCDKTLQEGRQERNWDRRIREGAVMMIYHDVSIYFHC